MQIISWSHIMAHGERELATDNDAEGEFVAHIDGLNLRVTYYASREFGPSYEWDIDDDDTGDSVASSRLSMGDLRADIAVDVAVIEQLSRELYDDSFDAE